MKIKQIKIYADNVLRGSLNFTYLQDIEGLNSEFTVPTRTGRQSTISMDSEGLLWLTKLLEASQK